MYAWSQPHRGITPEDDIFQFITQTLQQWNGYVYGTGWQILWEMNGEANDWMYGEQGEKPRVMSWLFEVGSSCWPVASQIPYLVNQNIDPCLYLIEIAGDYMSPRVTLTPLATPIQIPASGGSFEYNIASSNHALAAIVCDIWEDVTLPNGTIYGPVLGPVEITTPGGSSLNRDRTQLVPANAPEGTYSYNAYLGIYPDVTWHVDSFEFEKLETGDDVLLYNWFSTGEPLGDADEMLVYFNQTQPTHFVLCNAYPNPFNPITTISFDLPHACRMKLQVFDIAGRIVGARRASPNVGFGESNLQKLYSPGHHEITFDGAGLASGVYIYRLEALSLSGSEATPTTYSGKMVLMK